MSQAPVMPLFTDALIGDTMNLSVDEFGAYCLLLIATWRNNGKALADNDRDLAHICRMSTRRWQQSFRERLLPFFNVGDGFWHQKRLEKEWERVRQTRAKQQKKASASVAARTLKKNETAPTVVQPTLTLTIESPNGASRLNADALSRRPGASHPAARARRADDDDRSGSNGKSHGRGSRLANDWEPDADACAFCERCGLVVASVAPRYRDYWLAQPGQRGVKRDWPAVWRNWCRREADLARAAPGPRSRSNGSLDSRIAAALDQVRIAPRDGGNC